uniref:Secreted in xylem 5 n=1 Tax=Fusarium oxysporum f. sp. cepae TaxID=396571 RepID=A0A0S3CV56_FUSOX|nr:secreted in xylem 5 [Fusarium oxysporum f. sp. cepae]UVW62045.1 secreted in xylem 5 [Fusarium oxysporum f. sp. cepae]BDS00603.1 secreted in xylem 5 [Fusarium oxysporum f. sp. cepae]
MRFEYISVVLALCGTSLARHHQYCACQSGDDDSINIDATTQLQNNHPHDYVWAQKSPAYWYSSGEHKALGPHFTGIYLKAANGDIDGETFYDLCHQNGGADSTCFDCSKSHQVGDIIYCDAS